MPSPRRSRRSAVTGSSNGRCSRNGAARLGLAGAARWFRAVRSTAPGPLRWNRPCRAPHPPALAFCPEAPSGSQIAPRGYFPSTARAGKSILSVQLAAAGVRVFCDDVLPIGGSNNFGMALGILPRLRLPLPDGLDPAFHDFLRHRRGPRNSNRLYVNLTDDELAPLGTEAPVRGIVMLQRDPEATPELVPEEKSETLRQVIWQNFAREGPALEILDRLQAITAEADCFTLRYATGEQAITLLQAAFGASRQRTEIRS